jgi:hypothetical protein
VCDFFWYLRFALAWSIPALPVIELQADALPDQAQIDTPGCLSSRQFPQQALGLRVIGYKVSKLLGVTPGGDALALVALHSG